MTIAQSLSWASPSKTTARWDWLLKADGTASSVSLTSDSTASFLIPEFFPKASTLRRFFITSLNDFFMIFESSVDLTIMARGGPFVLKDDPKENAAPITNRERR